MYVIHRSLKINKRGILISSGGRKNRKINKRLPHLLGTEEYVMKFHKNAEAKVAIVDYHIFLGLRQEFWK